MVRVRKLMAIVSEAPTASMPSVSRKMVTNSSHSRMVDAMCTSSHAVTQLKGPWTTKESRYEVRLARTVGTTIVRELSILRRNSRVLAGGGGLVCLS